MVLPRYALPGHLTYVLGRSRLCRGLQGPLQPRLVYVSNVRKGVGRSPPRTQTANQARDGKASLPLPSATTANATPKTILARPRASEGQQSSSQPDRPALWPCPRTGSEENGTATATDWLSHYVTLTARFSLMSPLTACQPQHPARHNVEFFHF